MAAQVRGDIPAFCGISGSTSTIFRQGPLDFAAIIVFHFIGNFNCNLVENCKKSKKGSFSFCPKSGDLFFHFLLNYSFPVLALILMPGFLS